MDENNRRSFLVQKIQEKKCSECSEQAVFVEMKNYEQRLTTNTDI